MARTPYGLNHRNPLLTRFHMAGARGTLRGRLAKPRQPERRVVTDLGDDAIHHLNIGDAARDHVQFVVELPQIELADDTVVTLLDQEHARAGLQTFLEQ